MTEARADDLNALIAERVTQDENTLAAIQERMEDLILAKEILEAVQAARKNGVAGNWVDIIPNEWAAISRRKITTEGESICIDGSKNALHEAIGRISIEFVLPQMEAKIGHSHLADSLAIRSDLF